MHVSAWTGASDVDLASAFVLAAHDATDRVAGAVVGHGGAVPAALTLLRARPGIAIEELRLPLGLSQPGAVRLVDRVEAEGWVRRERPGGRRLALYLTPAGRRVTETLLERRAAALEALLAPLTEAERADFGRLLAKVVSSLVTTSGDHERVCRLCDRDRCASCPVAAAVAAAEEREQRLIALDLALRLDDPEAPAEELNRLLAEAESVGDLQTAAAIEARLAMTAMARGDYAEVMSRLERARPRLTVDADALAIATLARAYALSGRADDAVALLNDALAEAERVPENPLSWIRFAVYLSYALTDAGRYAEAREVVRRAEVRSRRVDDPHTRVRVQWAAGRLALFEHDLQRAQRHYARIIELLEPSEDEHLLGRAHISQALAQTLSGQIAEAGASLRRAEALLGPHPDEEDLYWLRTEQARQTLAASNPGRARELAGEALALIGDDDPSARGAALAVQARARAAQGAVDDADPLFRDAVELLSGQREWYEAAAAAAAWAEMLTRASRAGDAERVTQLSKELRRQAVSASGDTLEASHGSNKGRA